MNCQAVIANCRSRKNTGKLGFFRFAEKGATAAAPTLNPAYLLAISIKILPILPNTPPCQVQILQKNNSPSSKK